MQPYFLPYIGYFQLMSAVDEYIIYDNIEYSKKGWINRNRILVNGSDSFITIPLKKDSDYLNIKDRQLADSWSIERKKVMSKIVESYRKAPFFKSVTEVIERSLLCEDQNLFNFIHNSLSVVKEYLEIQTPVIVSSTIKIDHTLKSEKKVIEICKARNAINYINPIGGVDLYNREDFKKEGIVLNFLKSDNISYNQFGNEFIPWLSIIDVMMFNSKDDIKKYLKSGYTII